LFEVKKGGGETRNSRTFSISGRKKRQRSLGWGKAMAAEEGKKSLEGIGKLI